MRDTILTQPAATQGLRHDRTTIALHWTTAVLVAVLWTIGQTIDIFPNGPLRIDYRSIHIVCGVLLGMILVVRLAWRLTRRQSLPPIDHGALLFIARFTHWLLYTLLIVTVGLGVAYLWVRGDSIFNLFRVPAFDPVNRRALSQQVGGWHALAANTILVVAGLHAAVALFHHFILRDATLIRMLPWRLR
jgi:cytochrome b561